jgi:uncharacterized protein (DUF433 family)
VFLGAKIVIEGELVMDYAPKPYKHYRWIVADPDLLGGKPTVRGTRLSVSHILECLSVGMTLEEINESFASDISPEIIAEVLSVGAELADKPCVAA